MSELEINTPEKEIPDALKTTPVVEEKDISVVDEKDTKKKEVIVNQAESKITKEAPKPKPIVKAEKGEELQSVEAGPIGYIAPLIGIDVATQVLPGGITGGELTPEAKDVAAESDRIANLNYQDFKQGVLNGSIYVEIL